MANFPAGKKRWRSSFPERQPLRDRTVHFEGPDSSYVSGLQSPPLPWYASPGPATPRPIGVPYPQHNAPGYQSPEWTYDAYEKPFEAIPHLRPCQQPESVYNVPFTDRGSLLNLVRSLHDVVLLGLPLLYHRRLARVREKADFSQSVVAWAMDPAASYPFLPYRKRSIQSGPYANPQPQMTSARQQAALGGHSKGPRVQWDRFRDEWESFVFTSTQEWQTLNIISALLLRCVSLVTDPIY